MLSSRVTQLTAAVAGLYWVLSLVVPTDLLRDILEGVVVSSSMVVVLLYLPITSEELLKNRLDRLGRLLLGIVLGWVTMLMMRPLTIYARLTGDNWLLNSPLLGFMLWIISWSAVLHITAPGADRPHAPQGHLRNLTWAVAVGALIAGIIIGLRLGHVVEVNAR